MDAVITVESGRGVGSEDKESHYNCKVSNNSRDYKVCPVLQIRSAIRMYRWVWEGAESADHNDQLFQCCVTRRAAEHTPSRGGEFINIIMFDTCQD